MTRRQLGLLILGAAPWLATGCGHKEEPVGGGSYYAPPANPKPKPGGNGGNGGGGGGGGGGGEG